MNPDPIVERLKAQLGPNFNYSALAQPGMIDRLPAEMRDAARKLVAWDLQRQQLSSGSSFAADMTQRTGMPMPVEPGGGAPSVIMQGLGMLGRGIMDLARNAQYLNPAVALSGAAAATPIAPQPLQQAAQAQLREDFATGRGAQVMQEFGHQISVGIAPAPTIRPEEREAWDAVVKPATAVGAMVAQGGGILRMLGYASKLPKAAPMLEKLPQRMREAGIGVVTMGAVDAMRAEGLPEHPSTLDPAAQVGRKLADMGLPDRMALGLGGAAVGGTMSATLLGIARGIGLMREASYARAFAGDPAMQQAVREALTKAGVVVPETMQPRDLARLFSNLRKSVLDEDLAGLVGERLAREEYIVQELFGGATIAPASEDGRTLAAMFRTNTGGTTVLTGVTDFTVIEEASKRLGLKLQFHTVRRGTQQEDIVAAAIRIPDGRYFAGRYHAEAANIAKVTEYESGFVTSSGRYVSTEEAARIARRPGAGLYPGAERNLPTDVRAEQFQFSRRDAPETPVMGEFKPTGMTSPYASGEVPVYDVLVSRPHYEYAPAQQAGKRANVVGKKLEALSKSKADRLAQTVSKEAWLLPDGTPVRGGFTQTEIDNVIKLPKPVVNGVARGDLALRVHGQIIRMELQEGNKALLELPTKLSSEQFDALGRMFDVAKFDQVTMVDVTGKSHVLTNPLGAQVQDAVADIVKPVKTSQRLTPKLVQQYKNQGVFEGQAGVLADGSPVSVRAKRGALYEVVDPLTGDTRRVHPSKLTVLPTTLEGEMAPSYLFLDHLDSAERAALAKLRAGLGAGLAQPVKTFRDLEGFASTRGFMARSLKAGGVELTHGLSGEAMVFANRKAAIAFIQKSTGPMPELTPPEIDKLLGKDTRLGMIGGGGAPPRFGETIPLDMNRILGTMDQVVTDRVPTFWMRNLDPTLAAVERIDAKLKTKIAPVFRYMQSQKVAETNFVARWYGGRGEKLPNNIRPFKDIHKTAGGNDADWEAITHWLEVPKGTPDEAALLASMTPGEQTAAKQLREWYDELFKEFGIEADYLENYAPRWRQMGQTHGNQPLEVWKATGGDPLNPPKGVQFFADQYREGVIDIYEENAARAALSYLRQGAHNRFMKEAYDNAKKTVAVLKGRNESAAEVLGRATLAMRGMESGLETAAMQESILSIIEKLPGSAPKELTANVAERMSNGLLGMFYSGAMGFRFSLAMRNAASAFYMSWPIYGGGNKTKYLEALGKAMTPAGFQEAVAARAVSLKSTARSMLQDVGGDLGSAVPALERFVDQSMWMYDTADEFARSVAFHSAKDRTLEALTDFARKVPGKSADEIARMKDKLISDTGLWMQRDDAIEDFWRRASHNADDAATYAGKMASDVTNFLYGRGMQGRWQRSIPGRLLGQFGSWSLWYADYLRRVGGRALGRDGRYRGAAIKALVRHGLVNAGIILTGREVLNVDLNRWVSYGSVFYSGGPGFQVAMGAATLQRGMGGVATFGEDPLAQARVSEGLSIIEHTLPMAIPLYSAGREAVRLFEGYDATDRLAAVLGTRPTREYNQQRRFELMFGTDPRPFVSDSPVLEDVLNARAGFPVDVAPVPILPALPQLNSHERAGRPTVAPQPPAQGEDPSQALRPATVAPTVPQGIAYPRGGEASSPAEAPPIGGW